MLEVGVIKKELWGAVSFLSGVDMRQTSKEVSIANQGMGRLMIRMAVGRHGGENDGGAEFSEEWNDFVLLVGGIGDAAIRQARVFAMIGPQDLSSGLRFLRAQFRCATRAHFTAGEIEESNGAAFVNEFGNQPPDAQFDVVGVCANGKDIHAHSSTS